MPASFSFRCLASRLALTTALILVAASALVARAAADPGSCTVAAAGDVAGRADWADGAARTAALIERSSPRAVLALGDLAYDSGTRAEFEKYYDPTWGRFRAITRPTPGNHEYNTAAQGGRGHDAGAYFAYFGVPPQYSFDLCGWHVVSLNSEVDPERQAAFLAADVAQHPGRPLLVFWHRPRFSSGKHGNNADVQPLWAAAARAGASIVLGAHDHDYERFVPRDAAGRADPSGIRQFVAGGGGHHPRKVSGRVAHSEVVVEGLGVLFLDLQSTGYSWRYQGPNGRVHDEGQSAVRPL